MRVGLFRPVASERIGGGYTFEHEIFERLLECAPISKHEFVVFEALGGNEATSKIPNFKDALYKRPFSAKQLYRNARSVFRTASSVPKPTYQWKDEGISDFLAGERIEFFINVSPNIAIVDVPFLAVVWDLQHRLHPFFPEVSSRGEWQRRETFFSQVLRRAAYIVTGTDTNKKEVQMFYGIPRERIRIFPHPTPSFVLEDRAKDTSTLAQFRLPPNYIFYPAQFWSHKNHVGILRALLHLKEKDNLRLPAVFAGSDQGNEGYIRQLAQKLQLNDQVFFLGHVSRPALRALYQNALVLCYVSFLGPLNLPPLEAFALGCPVIAADMPGAKEQFEDAAILVDPADDLQIAQALRSLFTDNTKRELLIHRGKERAHRFTGRDFAKSLLGLLDEFESIRRCWSVDLQNVPSS
jgi:glycosyltransferase involved in cell wall biosynthesis